MKVAPSAPRLSAYGLAPCLLSPRFVPKVWGGRRLASRFGYRLPPSRMIGEALLLYDSADGCSVPVGGGWSLGEMMRRAPSLVLGEGVRPTSDGRFPLLLKLLDVRRPLSVQVHPGGAPSKHECQVVLDAGPAARMVCGLRPGVAVEDLARVTDPGCAVGLTSGFRPRAGQCIDVPPGAIHGSGPDVLLFECQQNSDATYRIYDWNRGRELQVAAAKAVAERDRARASIVAARLLADGGLLLQECEWFRVRRYLRAMAVPLPTGGRFLTLTCLDGAATVHWRGRSAGKAAVACGDTLFVPACVDGVEVKSALGVDLVVCDPGLT
ncbi:MAG: class I mannose-6-phosphate isomerase [bacterium]|nr:class I mannose-6-phosphate isomerase [bacterium]